MLKLNSQWRFRALPAPDRRELRRFAAAAAAAAGLPAEPEWECNILFVNDAKMAELNFDLLGHEGTTDVITFSYFDDGMPYEAGETMVELIINPDAAAREGAVREGGYATEMALYIVHGLLHSAGEDDLSPGPRARMRRRERECLAQLEKEFDFKKLFPETK